MLESHPSRGGWIEMISDAVDTLGAKGPTPHGVGGLKFLEMLCKTYPVCPTPHGVGGLKYISLSFTK